MDMSAHSAVRHTIEVDVIRADGTIDHIGLVGDSRGMKRIDTLRLWLRVKWLNKRRTGRWNGPKGG